jgi:hypothetical protein
MRVLVACERSGVVRQAFRDRGHNEAVTCSFGKEPCAPALDSWVLTDGNLRIEIPFGHPEITNLHSETWPARDESPRRV